MTKAQRAEFYRAVGAQIRALRKRKLNQSDLADRLGMSRVSIVNIEAGRQAPPLHVLCGIAKILGVNLGDLVPQPSRAMERLEQRDRELAAELLKD